MAKLKVYGWTSHAPYGHARQGRYIMAASSVAELTRITGVTRHDFNNYGSVTGNREEIELATSKPGIVFRRPLDVYTGGWEEMPPR